MKISLYIHCKTANESNCSEICQNFLFCVLGREIIFKKRPNIRMIIDVYEAETLVIFWYSSSITWYSQWEGCILKSPLYLRCLVALKEKTEGRHSLAAFFSQIQDFSTFWPIVLQHGSSGAALIKINRNFEDTSVWVSPSESKRVLASMENTHTVSGT